ncbi:hypothetical protein CPB97_005508, partial [Podila verticillata]
PPHHTVSALELPLLSKLSGLANMRKSHTELKAWLRSKALLPESIVHKAIEKLLVDSSLWSKVDWSKEDEDNNEDTFTSYLIKLLLTPAFGRFTGCSFRC